jgi:hypothetical protein
VSTLTNDCNELTQLIGDLVDGQLTDDCRDRLLQLLRNDPSARNYYLDYMELHARLQWRYTETVESETTNDGPGLKNGQREAKRGEQSAILSSDLLVQDSSINHPQPSPIPILLDTTIPSTVGYFSSDWSLAYLIATVVCGVAALVGSLIYVSRYEEVVNNSPSRAVERQLDALPKVETVGRITGMVDCKWAKDGNPLRGNDAVSLGCEFKLDSGLVEIGYSTGARVILQGPVSYVVESKNGGFMSAGKLTGKVTTASAKGFVVRTPTATVTDLGTEFGVEVDKHGNYDVQVFVGEVKVQLPPDNGRKPREIHLTENHAIRFLVASNTVADRVAAPERFVRKLNRFEPRQVIGVNFTHGDYSNLTPEEVTGVVRAGCWNNVDGDPLPPPTVPLLRDSAGKETSARLSWQWSYPGTALPYRTYLNYSDGREGSSAVYPFEKLMDGFFNGVVEPEAGDDATNVAKAVRTSVSLTIGVSGVPYQHYRVFVYYSTRPATDDPTNPLMHTFGLSVNGSKPLIVSRPKYWLNDFYRYQSDTRSGNYQVFENLSGDLTIGATPDGPGPLHDKFITGFQIVETQQ